MNKVPSCNCLLKKLGHRRLYRTHCGAHMGTYKVPLLGWQISVVLPLNFCPECGVEYVEEKNNDNP